MKAWEKTVIGSNRISPVQLHHQEEESSKRVEHGDGTTNWTSQTLVFKLDMQNSTLEMSIGGNCELILEVGGNCNRVRPFVCIDGPAKVTLIKKVVKFPSEFQNDVRFYSSLMKKETLWAFGAFKHREFTVNDLEIRKSSGNNSFACAVGNEDFSKGVHTWKISVDREVRDRRVWVGVVGGALQRDDLDKAPEELDVDFIMVFCSDGLCICKDRIRRGTLISTVSESRKWPEHQVITLKLDMRKHILEIFAYKKLACTVSGFGDRRLRPYVCIEGIGSVTLESRESSVLNSNSSMVSFRDRAVGLDNAEWDDQELNDALLNLPVEGSSLFS